MRNDPEEFVEPIEPWPRMSTFQNCELLPKREILPHKPPAAAKKANEYSEPEQKPLFMNHVYNRLRSETRLYVTDPSARKHFGERQAASDHLGPGLRLRNPELRKLVRS